MATADASGLVLDELPELRWPGTVDVCGRTTRSVAQLG